MRPVRQTQAVNYNESSDDFESDTESQDKAYEEPSHNIVNAGEIVQSRQ